MTAGCAEPTRTVAAAPGPDKSPRPLSGHGHNILTKATDPGWVIFDAGALVFGPDEEGRGYGLICARSGIVVEVVVMQVAGWHVEVEFDEDETHTRAAALLRLRDDTELRGKGHATRNPADPDERRIGEELAGGRALMDIAQQLTAKGNAEAKTLR